MTSVVQRILIIGGGFSGMSPAIELRKQGTDVDLVEIDPGRPRYGAGIRLDIPESFLAQGSATNSVRLCAPQGPRIMLESLMALAQSV